MRRPPSIGDGDPLDGERRAEAVEGGGMDHEAGVHVGVRPVFEEEALAATTLFSGRAQQDDASRQLAGLQSARRAECRCDASNSNEVVTAGMTNAGQSIHFGVEAHSAVAGPIRTGPAGRPSGGQVADATLHRPVLETLQVGAQRVGCEAVQVGDCVSMLPSPIDAPRTFPET